MSSPSYSSVELEENANTNERNLSRCCKYFGMPSEEFSIENLMTLGKEFKVRLRENLGVYLVALENLYSKNTEFLKSNKSNLDHTERIYAGSDYNDNNDDSNIDYYSEDNSIIDEIKSNDRTTPSLSTIYNDILPELMSRRLKGGAAHLAISSNSNLNRQQGGAKTVKPSLNCYPAGRKIPHNSLTAPKRRNAGCPPHAPCNSATPPDCPNECRRIVPEEAPNTLNVRCAIPTVPKISCRIARPKPKPLEVILPTPIKRPNCSIPTKKKENIPCAIHSAPNDRIAENADRKAPCGGRKTLNAPCATPSGGRKTLNAPCAITSSPNAGCKTLNAPGATPSAPNAGCKTPCATPGAPNAPCRRNDPNARPNAQKYMNTNAMSSNANSNRQQGGVNPNEDCRPRALSNLATPPRTPTSRRHTPNAPSRRNAPNARRIPQTNNNTNADNGLNFKVQTVVTVPTPFHVVSPMPANCNLPNSNSANRGQQNTHCTPRRPRRPACNLVNVVSRVLFNPGPDEGTGQPTSSNRTAGSSTNYDESSTICPGQSEASTLCAGQGEVSEASTMSYYDPNANETGRNESFRLAPPSFAPSRTLPNRSDRSLMPQLSVAHIEICPPSPERQSPDYKIEYLPCVPYAPESDAPESDDELYTTANRTFFVPPEPESDTTGDELYETAPQFVWLDFTERPDTSTEEHNTDFQIRRCQEFIRNRAGRRPKMKPKNRRRNRTNVTPSGR